MENKEKIFLHYKQRLINECAPVNSGAIRFNCIEYLCQFPGIDPVEMATALQHEGHAIMFDDSSIRRDENRAKQRKVNRVFEKMYPADYMRIL